MCSKNRGTSQFLYRIGIRMCFLLSACRERERGEKRGERDREGRERQRGEKRGERRVGGNLMKTSIWKLKEVAHCLWAVDSIVVSLSIHHHMPPTACWNRN